MSLDQFVGLLHLYLECAVNSLYIHLKGTGLSESPDVCYLRKARRLLRDNVRNNVRDIRSRHLGRREKFVFQDKHQKKEFLVAK